MIRFAILALGLLLVARPTSAQSLDEAYRTELRVLSGEQSQLQKALKDTESSSATARRALLAELETLSAQLARTRVDNAARGETRPDPTEQANRLQLTQLLEQIETAVAHRGINVPATMPSTPPKRLEALVDASLEELAASSGLRIERGAEVFGVDGLAHQQDVLRIGEVGAVEWGGSHRPLVRGIDGSQRVVVGLTGGTTTTSSAQSIEVVLFDPQKPPKPGRYAPRSAWAKLDSGGLLVWPLLVLAAAMLLVAIERFIALNFVARRVRSLVTALRDWRPPQVGESRVPESIDASHWLAAPAVSVIQAANNSRAVLEEHATEALLRIRPRMARRLSVLSVTAAAAPLVGLLGTVTGMITTFSVITEHGTGDPQLLSGGISEALLTTQLGLAVAIPALLMHVALSRWAARLADTNQALVFDLVHAAHPLGHDHDHDYEELDSREKSPKRQGTGE